MLAKGHHIVAHSLLPDMPGRSGEVVFSGVHWGLLEPYSCKSDEDTPCKSKTGNKLNLDSTELCQ